MQATDYEYDWEYARSRLRSSVVRYNGYPVYIFDVEPNCIASFNNLYFHKEHSCHFHDLDISPMQLGYVNNKTSSVFCSRKPNRYYKQGLTQDNIRTNGPVNMNTEPFVNMIMNVYDSPMACAEEIICGERIVKAFSKNFALQYQSDNELVLLFKTFVVGTATVDNPDSLNFKLENKFEFLSEMLEEEKHV